MIITMGIQKGITRENNEMVSYLLYLYSGFAVFFLELFWDQNIILNISYIIRKYTRQIYKSILSYWIKDFKIIYVYSIFSTSIISFWCVF